MKYRNHGILLLFFLLQLQHALQRQKSLFENINIDWNLSHDEGSTDFSDDETVVEDRVSKDFSII